MTKQIVSHTWKEMSNLLSNDKSAKPKVKHSASINVIFRFIYMCYLAVQYKSKLPQFIEHGAPFKHILLNQFPTCRQQPETASTAGCELTWHGSKSGLGAVLGMPEGPCTGEGSMNESMQFTRTVEDTVHPPPCKVADCGLQCQRRSSQQAGTPSYSSSMHTHHKRLLCLEGKKRVRMWLCVV